VGHLGGRRPRGANSITTVQRKYSEKEEQRARMGREGGKKGKTGYTRLAEMNALILIKNYTGGAEERRKKRGQD